MAFSHPLWKATCHRVNIYSSCAKHPKNDDNLYDSRGEFFESLEKYEKAKASYLMALNVLKQKKSTLDLVSFENKERLYRGNYNRVKEK